MMSGNGDDSVSRRLIEVSGRDDRYRLATSSKKYEISPLVECVAVACVFPGVRLDRGTWLDYWQCRKAGEAAHHVDP